MVLLIHQKMPWFSRVGGVEATTPLFYVYMLSWSLLRIPHHTS